MTALRLKATYLQAILDNPDLQGQIAVATGRKSNVSVYRWAKDNSPQLTMLSALNAIRSFLKLPKNESLVEEIEVTEKAGV